MTVGSDSLPSSSDGEQKDLCEFISELNQRNTVKENLRQRNLKANDCRPDEAFFRKLDSNLKKNTAFAKKLRTLTEGQRESILKDFAGLNLTKYVAELATAMVDVKLKMSDVPAAVEICSLIHQRYADFAALLLAEWKKIFPRKKSDKVENFSKLRVDLRFFAELVSFGVLDEKEGLPVLGSLLGYLVNTDKEEHNNLSLLTSFCKFCGDDYAGLVPRKFRLLAEKYLQTIPCNSVFNVDRQKNVRTLLNEYFLGAQRHVEELHRDMRRMERQNMKALLTRGEVHPEAQQRYDEAKTAFEKLHQAASAFAEQLDADMPELCMEPIVIDGMTADDSAMVTQVEFGHREDGGGGLLWEDEDTRMFYETLPELRVMLPGILFKESEQATLPKFEEKVDEVDEHEEVEGAVVPVNDVAGRKEGDERSVSPEQVVGNEQMNEEHDEAEDEEAATAAASEDVSGSTLKLMMDAFVDRLPNMVNRDLMDNAAVDFVTTLNTSTNRKRLVKALFGVHRTRLDLLPFYARLVATLVPVMPDVGTELVKMLVSDFRYQVRKKDQVFIEAKIKVVRFLGELVKFRICPKSEVLHCLKMLLFDFRHHNIEMACNLLDTCGYFLYHSPDSHHRTRVLLEQMQRKKQTLHMNQRYEMMIDNVYYQCNPPAVSAIAKIERPPMHEYVRKLLFQDLNKNTVEKVLKQLRKLNWEDAGVAACAVHCLSAPWHIRFGNVHCLASLVAGLMYYYEYVGHEIVDNILEEIRVGMEVNHPKFNQRRMVTVRYLGEMYNYRCVDSNIIFNVLYSLISFGVNVDGGVHASVFDPPEHLFRLRLTCALLETCGHYFDRGSTKKKLDYFLTYLQRYYWTKRDNAVWASEHPFPVETENVLRDTIELLRPNLPLFRSLDEAQVAVKEIEDECKSKVEDALKFVQTDDVSPVDIAEYASGERQRDLDTIDEGEEEETRRPLSTSQDANSQSTDDREQLDRQQSIDDHTTEIAAEDTPVHVARLSHAKTAEDDDFMAAFDKMMAESVQQRLQETVKIPQTEIMVPTNVKTKLKTHFADGGGGDSGAEDVDETAGDRTTVNFVVMLKGKGNKPSLKTLKVPLSSDLAQSVRVRAAVELEEKARMKQLTLQRQHLMEEEERFEAEAEIRGQLFQDQRRGPLRFQHQKGAPNPKDIFSGQWH